MDPNFPENYEQFFHFKLVLTVKIIILKLHTWTNYIVEMYVVEHFGHFSYHCKKINSSDYSFVRRGITN